MQLSEGVGQLRKDKQDLLVRLDSTEPEVTDDDDKLARLDTEVGTLKTERQLLIGRLRTAEQLVAEARGTVDQKEGHLQGLQVSSHITALLLLWVCSFA